MSASEMRSAFVRRIDAVSTTRDRWRINFGKEFYQQRKMRPATRWCLDGRQRSHLAFGLDAQMADGKLPLMQAAVRTLLLGVGEDPDREGLVDTPKRVAKALLDATAGYGQTAESVLGSAFFHEPLLRQSDDAGLVLVRDIDFASTSEATLLPFHGRCHVAYVPGDGVILGLSKLARLVRLFSKRLQTPAGLAAGVVEVLQQHLACKGVAAVVQAQQLAFTPASPEVLSFACVSGCFAESGAKWQEFLSLLDLELLPPAAVHTVTKSHLSTAALERVARESQQGIAAPDTPDVSEWDLSIDGDLNDLSIISSCSDLQASSDRPQAGTSGAADAQHRQEVWHDEASASEPSAASPAPADGRRRSITQAQMEAAVNQLLVEVGEDPRRQALQSSAACYVQSLLASTSGYHETLPQSRRHPERVSSSSAGMGLIGSEVVQRCSCCGCTAVGRDQHVSHEHVSTSLRPSAEAAAATTGATSWSPDAAMSGAGGTSPTAFWPDPNAPDPALAMCSASSRSLFGGGGNGGTVCRNMVTAQLPFTSQCEHHMLPFYGTLCIAYLPSGTAGVSGTTLDSGQLKQIVAMFTRRLQVQERITQQVAGAVQELTGAAGVLVLCDAAHMCMVARGVENHHGRTTTLVSRGAFERQPELRRQALAVWRSAGRG